MKKIKVPEMIIFCDQRLCGHFESGKCKLKTVRLHKVWSGIEKDWDLMCLDTTDKTYRHPK